MGPYDGPSMRERWSALEAPERRALKRVVQDGGPIDPSRRLLGSWYAEQRFFQLVLLVTLSATVFVVAFAVGVMARHPVTWIVVGILGLSLFVTVAELRRVRRLRDELADPTDPF